MSGSLSSLTGNFTEGFHNNKFKDCKSCLEYILTINKYLIFKCLEYKKSYKNILIKI